MYQCGSVFAVPFPGNPDNVPRFHAHFKYFFYLWHAVFGVPFLQRTMVVFTNCDPNLSYLWQRAVAQFRKQLPTSLQVLAPG